MRILFKDKLSDEQLSELNQYIEASESYYSSEAIMSDPQFDNLKETLLDYNIPELTEFVKKTIFRDNVGMAEVSEYTQEMISLEKIKWENRSTVTEINKFFRLSKNGFGVKKKIGAKYDGSAIKIVRDFNSFGDKIKQILTRGGLDVTKMLCNHPDIIYTAKYRKNIICGELVIEKSIFYEKYSIENGGDFENARNFVGKLFKQKYVEPEIINDLNFVACTDGINPLDNEVWSEITDKDMYSLDEMIVKFKSDKFPYLCDGLVIAYNVETREVKDNYPLNMLSVKFPGSKAKTTVTDMYWTQKKTGNLTPMCLVEHVQLDGITATRASAYNFQNCIDLGIGIGSVVEIEKSGDIIPCVVRVLQKSNNIKYPKIEYTKIGKHLRAVDMEESRRYKFILGIKLLQIEGIGEVIAEQIGSVVDYQIEEIFNKTHKPDMCVKLGSGANLQKFLKIYEIKTIHLDKLIAMLQFNQVGPVIAKKIALLITNKSTDKTNIPSEVLQTVCKGKGFQKINETIKHLASNGVRVIASVEISEDTLTFEMTGDVPDGLSKDKFVEKLKEIYPNAVHTSLTKETKILFTDSLSKNGGKINKARKYNVKVVLYSDALKGKI